MYDITSGKLLRKITDAHPPGSAVLHVKVSYSQIMVQTKFFNKESVV